jgi:predicted NUDIX family phosphoesterase/dephospho-CoA kinase
MVSEFLEIAQRLLERERKPMRPKELVDLALRDKLFSDNIAGKTPHQTMKSKLSVHVRRKGEASLFVRTRPGRFYLRYLLAAPEQVYEASPLRKPKAKERVLVFPTMRLDDKRRFQGITTKTKSLCRHLLGPRVCCYRDRLAAEEDKAYKQLVTYILITRGNSVLGYQRGNFNRVEDFLRGCHCIGFGGHVSAIDKDLFSSDMGIENCAVRELSEELKLPAIDKQRLQARQGLHLVGLLNDDSSDAGQKHFALIYRYEVSDDPAWDHPERGEKSITQLRWIGPATSKVRMWDFEYWSQLCLRRFFRPLLHAAPAYQIRRKRPLKPPHILCVLGPVGSGKTETTRVLKEEFGYTEVNSGRIVADLLGVPPVPQTPRETFQQLAWEFIQTSDGPERLAGAIWKQLTLSGGERILVDGIRQKRTIECLRTHAGDTQLGLLFVETPPDLAYKFFKEREGPTMTIFEFLNRRHAPVEQEINEMIGLSDAILYNWTGRSELRQAIKMLMKELLA